MKLRVKNDWFLFGSVLRLHVLDSVSSPANFPFHSAPRAASWVISLKYKSDNVVFLHSLPVFRIEFRLQPLLPLHHPTPSSCHSAHYVLCPLRWQWVAPQLALPFPNSSPNLPPISSPLVHIRACDPRPSCQAQATLPQPWETLSHHLAGLVLPFLLLSNFLLSTLA